MASKYRVIAVNEDEDCCDLCGKTNLTKVVWLVCDEWEKERPIGTDCAQKLLNLRAKSPKVVRGVLRDCIRERGGFIPDDMLKRA